MRFIKVQAVQLILMIAVLAVTTLPAAEKGVEKGSNFTFTKLDLSLLDQANSMDQKLEREGMIYHDEAMETYVTRVGRSMLPTGGAPERVKWEFMIVRDPMANAFAAPNGSIYITSGLLSLMENEDQLAGVLAHEITHVTDRHAYLAFRSYRKKAAIANIGAIAASAVPGGSVWGLAIQIAGSMLPVVMMASVMGYSRELERDADMYAYGKLQEGGYDPKELVNTFHLLERIDEAKSDKVYYNDHPKLDDRISYMSDLISSKPPIVVTPEVLATRKTNYLTVTEPVAREDIHLAILSRRPRTALARAKKLGDFHPGSAANLCAEADAYRSLGPWTPRPGDDELSKSGEKKEAKVERKFTADEEERRLLSEDEGQAAWKANQRLAEETYRKALALDPGHAKTHLGLGQLYEATGRKNEALAAYKKYLELQPTALDRQMIQGRIAGLQRSGAQ